MDDDIVEFKLPPLISSIFTFVSIEPAVFHVTEYVDPLFQSDPAAGDVTVITGGE